MVPPRVLLIAPIVLKTPFDFYLLWELLLEPRVGWDKSIVGLRGERRSSSADADSINNFLL
jgi:hypothetical protein